MQTLKEVIKQHYIDITVLSFILVLATWLRFVRVFGYSGLDDGVYVGACGLILQGYQPHRDFFLAQPPLFFWFVVGIWGILGLSDPYAMWIVGKVISLASFLGTTVLVYLIGYTLSKKRVAGFVGATLYQLSVSSLSLSVQFCPHLLSVFFTVLSLFLFLVGFGFIFVGLLLGLASITYVSSAVLIPAYVVYLVWRYRRGQFSRLSVFSFFIGFILPLCSLLVFPVDSLWHDLVVFHLVKGETETLWWHIEKLIWLGFSEDLPVGIGLFGILPSCLHPDRKRLLLSSSALLSLFPFFAQPIAFGHLLLQGAPFFAVTAGIVISGMLATQRKERIAAVVLIIILGVSLPFSFFSVYSVTDDLSRIARTRNRLIFDLVRITKAYTTTDDMIFSQLPVVSFLSGCRYPPLVDTTTTAMYTGIYTPNVVKGLITQYPLKVVIISFHFEGKLKSFFQLQGYIRVAKIQAYRVYVKMV